MILLFASLVFIGLQIKQNTNALKVSSYAYFESRHMDHNAFDAQHADVIVRTRGEGKLTDQDSVVFVVRMSNLLRGGDAAFPG